MVNYSINLKEWELRETKIYYNDKPDSLSCGWQTNIEHPMSICKHKRYYKNKMFPFLRFLRVQKNESDRLFPPNHERYPKELEHEIQYRFNQFYKPGMKSVVLDVSICAAAHNKVSTHNTYKIHEMLLEDFWVKNKIYKAPFKVKVSDGIHMYSDFEHDWCDLILVLWQNFLQLENYTIMDNIDFMHYIEILKSLMRDTIEKPLRELPDQIAIPILNSLNRVDHPEDWGHEGMSVERWSKRKPSDKQEAYEYRILDSIEYLNKFKEEYNYCSSKNALELYLVKLFESFGNELCSRKILTRCALCSDYFLFSMRKKYCSLKTEGKDCGKSARNKRYYNVKGKKRLAVYRKSTRELRAFYKTYGISK